jgi:hypothetical protein
MYMLFDVEISTTSTAGVGLGCPAARQWKGRSTPYINPEIFLLITRNQITTDAPNTGVVWAYPHTE